jgi:hypothetical protein
MVRLLVLISCAAVGVLMIQTVYKRKRSAEVDFLDSLYSLPSEVT